MSDGGYYDGKRNGTNVSAEPKQRYVEYFCPTVSVGRHPYPEPSRRPTRRRKILQAIQGDIWAVEDDFVSRAIDDSRDKRDGWMNF